MQLESVLLVWFGPRVCHECKQHWKTKSKCVVGVWFPDSRLRLFERKAWSVFGFRICDRGYPTVVREKWVVGYWIQNINNGRYLDTCFFTRRCTVSSLFSNNRFHGEIGNRFHHGAFGRVPVGNHSRTQNIGRYLDMKKYFHVTKFDQKPTERKPSLHTIEVYILPFDVASCCNIAVFFLPSILQTNKRRCLRQSHAVY